MNNQLPASLARVHSWARSKPWLGRFTLMNRLLLVMAFLPTGLVKATGHRFTVLPIDNPVGFFFEAMYQTGPYWYFIGISQVAAALLLLFLATATLGALLFFPIILSIVLITWGIGFGNTVFITIAMLVACLYLISWDADRIWAAASKVIGVRREHSLLEGANLVEKTGWAAGGLIGVCLLLVTRSFIPTSMTFPLLIAGGCAFLLVVIGWIMQAAVHRTSAEKSRSIAGTSPTSSEN